MPNDGIVSTLSKDDWARLCRRKNCGNELPPTIGLPPVDEDINRRSGEPLLDPRPHPSSEEENSLWSTPQQLAMRARQKLYAMAPAPIDEDIHHRSGEPFLNSGLSRSSDPDWQGSLVSMGLIASLAAGGWTKMIRRILLLISAISFVAVLIYAPKQLQLMWSLSVPRFSAPDISSAFSWTMSSLSHPTSPRVQSQNVPAAGENLTTVIVNNQKFVVPKSPENNFVRSSPARCEALKSINQCSAGSKNCAALLKELQDCMAHGL
jgi:hypothetical protein